MNAEHRSRQDVSEQRKRGKSAINPARPKTAPDEFGRITQAAFAELQHRVRNTLAVVRSIARRTADRSESVEQLISHFEGRLNAFSRIQSALARTVGTGVDLRTIVEDELLAVAAREGEHLHIEGPDLCLGPRPAESLGLAVHELATNAVKYGALSAAHGHIRLQWKRIAGKSGEMLHLEWVETGLDQKPAPMREGFGHEMLKRTLPYELGADTKVVFTDDGLRFTLAMPLAPEMLAE